MCVVYQTLNMTQDILTGDEAMASGEEKSSLIWTAKQPVITSSVVMRQMIMALGAGVLFLVLLILIISPGAIISVLPVLAGVFVVLVTIGVLVAGAIQILTKGGPEAMYEISATGVRYAAGSDSRMINAATLAGSLATGTLTGTGGSLLNISRESESIRWDEVGSITIQKRERTILIRRKILISPMLLTCTPDNFETVVDLIKRYAPSGTLH